MAKQNGQKNAEDVEKVAMAGAVDVAARGSELDLAKDAAFVAGKTAGAAELGAAAAR